MSEVQFPLAIAALGSGLLLTVVLKQGNESLCGVCTVQHSLALLSLQLSAL